ncbi:PDDEXK nuclease domain-containing protein [Alistipes putredinis]
MSNNGHNIEKTNFDAFINAVGSEIQQAQVRLITAANAQMLFHYWKMGNYILYHQQLHGWGSKTIKQLAKAIRLNFPEKKGYSERNLTYMCQFARTYPLRVLQNFIETDAKLIAPSVKKIEDEVHYLNDSQFTQEPLAQIQSTGNKEITITQEPLAQIQSTGNKEITITQEPLAQIHNVAKTVSDIYRMEIKDIENVFMASPVAKTNWASHVIMLNSSLPLGVSYWYMKQSVEMGWSSNVLKIQIETNLYSRQISNNKVNNFTVTLPAPQSDLANYLLKDPYIFDLAGTKEKADERDIEEQLVKHVTRYLLEMGNGFAFVARQKHFQIGNSDFFADLILYSIPLHAYIVVELKATPFKPEYAGQLNFYINVVDDKLRGENDNKTIGLLLCKGKDEVVAQYALTGYDQPIGISDYQLSKAIPENLKSALPSIEEVEEELTSFLDKDKNP